MTDTGCLSVDYAGWWSRDAGQRQQATSVSAAAATSSRHG